MNRKHEELAARFCAAMKKMCDNSGSLENFQNYLSWHFDVWMQEYANDPEGLTHELETFAEIE